MSKANIRFVKAILGIVVIAGITYILATSLLASLHLSTRIWISIGVGTTAGYLWLLYGLAWAERNRK
jgi:hypothetical protein